MSCHDTFCVAVAAMDACPCPFVYAFHLARGWDHPVLAGIMWRACDALRCCNGPSSSSSYCFVDANALNDWCLLLLHGCLLPQSC